MLSSLRPAEVASYLRQSGWIRLSLREGHSATWGREGEELYVPLSVSFDDYSQRMHDVLRGLSIVEDRDQPEVLADLLTAGDDVVRLRLIEAGFADGTVPIADHVLASRRAYDLVAAAARSEWRPQAVHRGSRADQVSDWLRHVRIGQSERGSYVLKVMAPVPPRVAPANGQLFEPEEPFGRRAALKLSEGLHAAAAAVERAFDGEPATVAELVAQGVSANLCDAVHALSAPEGRTLEVSFAWASSRPLDRPAPPPPPVRFGSATAAVLDQLARLLRGDGVSERFTLDGPIVRLERDDDTFGGRVTVRGQVGGHPREVAVSLTPDDYERAIDAHRAQQPLRCRGRLVQDGRSWRLEEPTGVRFEQPVALPE